MNKKIKKRSWSVRRGLADGICKNCLDILYPPRCPVCNGLLEDKAGRTCPECKSIFHPVTEDYCFKCGKPTTDSEEYCQECRSRQRSFRRGRGVFVYNLPMKESLLRYKYYGSREYGNYYAECICRYAGRDIRNWNPDVIVPVPMSKTKYKKRGFNQAADLALKVGKIMDIPVAEHLMIKVRETRSQKKLDAAERRRNLKNVFCTMESVSGLKILIMDDVYTTGSTVEALADSLTASGAEAVFFVTLCVGQV